MAIMAQNISQKSGYKQTEVGLIPKDWELKTIGESFDICNHLRYPISQDIRKKMAGEYPYYGPTKAQDYISEYRVEGEYALIGEDGDHFLKWRESPMTLLVNGKFNVNNHAHLVKGVRNLTSWFYYYFQNKDLTPYLTRQGAGRYKLTKNTLITIPCPLPKPKEQQAIATVLSDIDALITSLDRLITKKRDIKQATMQQLLTGKMRLPGFSGEWEVKKLKNECELITKGTTPTSLGKKFSTHGVNFIKIESLTNEGYIIWDRLAFIDKETHNLLRRSQLKSKDILFSIAGALGRTTLVKQDILPANTNQALALIRLKDQSCLDYIFLSKYLTSPEIIRHIGSINVQAAQANLSLEDVRNFEIRIPAVPEQQAIAAILSDIDAEIVALEQKRDKTRALKQGMMQELLTGKTRLL